MFLSFILCLCFLCCYCDFNISDLTEIPDMEGFRTSDLSGVLQTNSVVECAIECTNYLFCESLSYRSTKGLCLLHSFLFNVTTTEVIGEDDWKSYQYHRESCSTQSGYEYEQSLHWCYRLVEGNKLNAAQAADFCRLDGARMIRIDSLERHHHLTDLLCKFYVSRNIDSAWIGGHSAKDDNTFVYEDGTPLSYFNWLTGSPCYEKYIRIRVVGNFLWENGFGTQPRDFLCEH